jgi:hypothetical protein
MTVTREQVVVHLEQLRKTVRHPECRTCDCYVGFANQLQLDCVDDVSDLTGEFAVPKAEMHPCLGCEPCPPAELYADYLSFPCCPDSCCRPSSSDR